jgi:hypothetical protein
MRLMVIRMVIPSIRLHTPRSDQIESAPILTCRDPLPLAHIEDMPAEEMARRAAAAMGGSS